MANRPDGLPEPATATELYLAAILDALRGQSTAPSVPSEEERVKEPEPPRKKV